jgi:alpha-mannosidase
VTQLDGTRGTLITGQGVPAYGIAAIELEEADHLEADSLTITPLLLENRFFRIELDRNGEITSIYDKRRDREVVAAGQRANALVAFEDRPLNYDAWDIDHFYEEKAYPLVEVERVEVIETGPVRGGIEITRRFLSSTITQRVLIYTTLPRIDFQTEIDWHQHQMLLKAAFPLAINALHATHEIQFGAVERPTHRNTSWDMARFETCAQRWVDLSEGDYGVALLNDGKYGHDVHDNVVRLTLLTSGIHPDPEADQGLHRFTYSLLPHAGNWRTGEVVRRAAELNAPLIAARGARNTERDTRQGDTRQGEVDDRERLPLSPSPSLPLSRFVACDAEHVVVDTIKTAEDGDGLIVRLYEAHNARGPVTLAFDHPIAHAERCNLLEERAGDVEIDRSSVRFAITPFEIVTLRVKFGARDVGRGV